MCPKSNGKKAWYERPEWVAVIGSIIVVMAQVSGQVASTLIPIILGPDDKSDFSLSVDPAGLIESTSELPVSSSCVVDVSSLHQIIKPYRHSVFLKGSNVSSDIRIYFDKPEGKPPFKSKMHISIFWNCAPGEYPINISGIGGDGTIRQTTYLIEVRENANVPYNFSRRY